MMHHRKVAVFTTSRELFDSVKRFVPPNLAELVNVTKAEGEFPSGMTLALVDGKWGGTEDATRALLEKLSAAAVYTVLVDDEKHIGQEVPDALAQGLADDLLLLPIRPLELLGKIKHCDYLSRLNEMVSVNSGLKTLIEKFEEDIRTARAIQRTLIPEKFPPVHGIKVTHKYLSGLKSGGDYLDFFEFDDKTHVGILMSDSSGYGLSSAFMSVILRLAVKLSKDEVRSPSATVARIFEELSVTMKPNENLSIFYAILNRKTFELTYTSGGSIRFLHQSPEANARDARLVDRSVPTGALVKGSPFQLKDHSVTLQPSDRLLVFSDGFGETFEAPKELEHSLARGYGEDPMAVINDFTFRVKKTLEAEDDMPSQDCSVMVIDVEKRAMRLAK